VYTPALMADPYDATYHPQFHNPINPQYQNQVNQLPSPGDDPLDYINKTMAFLIVVASRFPSTNNQLRTSSNPRNQATIQDGRVTVQQVYRRQVQNYSGNGTQGNVAGTVFDAKQLAFLADLGISEGQAAQTTIQQNAVIGSF
ncbi:hypothetical protein Tco_1129684, partial [Tanacetum coccineum]